MHLQLLKCVVQPLSKLQHFLLQFSPLFLLPSVLQKVFFGQIGLSSQSKLNNLPMKLYMILEPISHVSMNPFFAKYRSTADRRNVLETLCNSFTQPPVTHLSSKAFTALISIYLEKELITNFVL